ncbi:MAG: hypothetical protein UT13_C0001G0489 [Candidatus Pacebacteria bacterium GW2011_GWF2_38_9]|nr:MAG: hypothetical protein US01_C0001G0502 [candidate division TM6 bacterium GW2011_GWF2_28_16]KKQ09334.1 MAG: hypothetical protein US20_C0008G0032 [Candidatus Pacebacteria bacterium GW2011_GWF1_36_5]KKQ88842.1 MAG: hypothetical protein UT13_C0001G0489 [Candidatus Pacebacteria bacterium GW2011_GWF2_38_9]HAZ73219.1 hypothetical protein [Candidatus Paceibacterota bacterium]
MFKIRNLYLAAFALILIFLFTRLYKIETSLLFFNDIGRDFLTLFKWQETGKPPLLGPQTSALPFNQSAIYFYLLYPFYLITGHSPYASLIAYASFYIISFITGLYFLRKYPRLEKSLLLVFLLIIVHPQYIIQGRFIWNPSFVTPCILVAFYSLIVYLEQKNPKKILLIASAFGISLATAFSYSAVPTLIAFVVLMLYRKPKKTLQYYLYIAISLLMTNLPTIVFELRHNFLLSKMMLFGDKIDQGKNFLSARISSLSEFTFATTWPWVLLYLVFIILFFYFNRVKKRNNFFENSFFLFFFTLALTILMPISIHSHYVFGVLPLLFLTVSFLRIKYIYLSAIFFYIIFIKAALRENYFAPARHNLAELQSCAKSFCEQQEKPLYIGNQSSHHPYHNAMEFQYLMSEAGCEVRDINTENGQATEMAVVLDDDVYEHGKTSYNELTLFGESKEKTRFVCSDSLEVVILEKTK